MTFFPIPPPSTYVLQFEELLPLLPLPSLLPSLLLLPSFLPDDDSPPCLLCRTVVAARLAKGSCFGHGEHLHDIE